MESQRYRLVLTGELHPGSDTDSALRALSELFQTPESALRGIFDGTARPVDQVLSAEDALELQGSLDRVGIRSRIERDSGSHIELKLRTDAVTRPAAQAEVGAVTPAGMMKCPACGHSQLVSNKCESCGVVFAEYHRNQANQGRQQAAASPVGGSAAHPAGDPDQMNMGGDQAEMSPHDVWGNDWLDGEEDSAPNEQHYMALFFGPPTERYLDACGKFLSGPRTRFGLSWNWAAFFSPFVWSLYRKMWGWSLVIFFTEIFLPVLLIVLGSYNVMSEKLVYVGYAGLIANRLFWPALANFLYCRYTRNTLQRLHMMSPNYATEIDIATAGGTSASSVLVGVAVAGVMSVFLWSVVDSMHESTRDTLIRSVELSERAALDGTTLRPRSQQDDLTGLTRSEMPVENKWVATRRMLRFIGQKANSWLAEHPGADPAQLSMFRLREDYSLSSDTLKDAWDSEIQYIPDNEGYRLISAGPDKLFGTADDVQYRRVLGEATL